MFARLRIASSALSGISPRTYLLLFIAVLMLIVSLAGVWFSPYPPDEMLDIPFAPVSAEHWLGTDYLGADVFSRVLSGGQKLVLSGIVVVVLAWILAGGLGMLAALSGGWRERLALALADLLQSIPGLLLVLLLVLVTGQQGYIVAALSSVLITGADIIRISRSATLQAMQHDYIDMARLRGESTGWILLRELAPVLLPLIIADAAIRFITAVFMLASVNFLGLGVAPPQADWGLMIMENRDGLALQPLAVLAPALALLLLLLPLTLLADGYSVVNRLPQGRKNHPPLRTKAAVSPPDAVFADASSRIAFSGFGLSCYQRRLLENINLQLCAGQITAVVGASGAGKTTLLHALAGELPAGSEQISGEIWLCGKEVLQLTASQCRQLRRHHVGYLPQDPRVALLPLQRAGSLLMRRAASLGIRGKQAKLLIEQQLTAVALPCGREFLRRLPHQLSGGQRQRLLLAMALMGDPAVLLLDEPGSAQDSVNTRALYRHVQQLAVERNIAVLLVAHGIHQVSDIADRFVVLDKGQVQEITPCAQFLRQPQSKAGQQLLQLGLPSLAETVSESRQAEAALSVCALNAFYQQKQALQNIDFQLAAGDCLNIVGASGCGKTTLLRCLLGLHCASSGKICWKNSPLALSLAERDCTQRRHMQYVAQNPYDSLNPYQSIHQLLQRPLTLFHPHLDKKQCQQKICQALEQVGLEPQLIQWQSSAPFHRQQATRIQQLSGGQRQRLALARALLAQPEILICDEVTSALDTANRQALISLLSSLRQANNLTLIMVTHDLALAAQCGGQLIVMDNGQIVESGSVAQVMRQPCQPITRELLQVSVLSQMPELLSQMAANQAEREQIKA